MSSGEMVQCDYAECRAWRYLYGEMTMFPWGGTFCKGECTDRAREFQAIVRRASTAQVMARVRKDYAVRRV